MNYLKKKVAITWLLVPIVFLVMVLGLSYSYYARAHGYIEEQDKAIVAYIGALQEANYNTTYNSVYTYDQLKKFVNATNEVDRQQALVNLINFKSKPVVTPPTVPLKQDL